MNPDNDPRFAGVPIEDRAGMTAPTEWIPLSWWQAAYRAGKPTRAFTVNRSELTAADRRALYGRTEGGRTRRAHHG
jgi:hypothetical protein